MALDYRRKQENRNNRLTENILDTLPPYVRAFIHSITVTKSDTTRLAYTRDLAQFMEYIKTEYLAGEEDDMVDLSVFQRIRTLDMKEYERYLFTEESLSSTTIKRRMSSIATFYKFLGANEMVKNNPMTNYDYPQVDRQDITYLTAENTRDLLDGIEENRLYLVDKPTGALDKNGKMQIEKVPEPMPEAVRIKRERFVLRDYAIVMLFLGTGLRVSELVGIDIKDLDFEKGCVQVTRKGKRQSVKRVYFGEEVAFALENYLDGEALPKDIIQKYPEDFLSFCAEYAYRADLEERAAKKYGRSGDAFFRDVQRTARATRRLGRRALNPKPQENALFISSWGRRLSVRSVELMVKEAALCYLPDLKNKDDITPHKLRATAATRILAQTGDILLAAKQLDHASPDVTAQRYAKLLEEDEKEKVSRLDITDW